MPHHKLDNTVYLSEMNKWIITLSFLVSIHISSAQTITEKLNAIKDLLQKTYPDSLPGSAVAVVQNEAVIFEKEYGIRNIENKESITSFTNFNIASLTKQFTALAILQLAEKGKLSLTDQLSRFFPDMDKKIAGSITIQELLTHSSGIRDHYEYVNVNGLKHAHNKDVYEAIKHIDSLYFKPGTKFRYSNTGYCLLALIIEKVSGMSYNDYMQKNIFQPAGMKNTGIWSETATVFEPATGYDKDSATNKFIRSGADEHIFFSTEGDGGIYTSIHDYLLWIKALRDGKTDGKKVVEQARSLQYSIDLKAKLGYGFGWFIDVSGKNKKVYHSGDNGGFRTYSFTIPDNGVAIVIFSNRSDIAVEDVAEKIYRILYPDEKPFVKIEVLTS